MMTTARFKESEKFELKSSFSEWKKTIVTLCAFANKRGGKVIVGLDDNGDSSGIRIGKSTIEDFANKVKNHTDPVLYPSINIKTFGLGEIVEIKIPESDNKPVFAFEKAYTRVGKTNQKLSQSEIKRLIRLYTLPDFDSTYLSAQESGKAELDEKLISRVNREFYKFPNLPTGKFLKKSGMLRNGKIMRAAYLCFAKKLSLMPNAVVKAARFKGVTVVKFLDEKEFDGDIINTVGQVMNFVKRHINTEFVITGRPKREEIWDYPLEALREAIINALVHRDYSDSGNIQIRIFDDRLEIWSPGLLPKEISVKNILSENRSIPRNKKLVEIFHRVKLMEGWGTGFQRIVEECENNGNELPVFTEKAGAFVISFEKRKGKLGEMLGERLGEMLGERLGKNQLKILELISGNRNIAIPGLAKALGISETAIENNLAKLKLKGMLKRVGPDKGGHWEINRKQ